MATQWITVGPIVKPAYEIDVATAKHAVIAGTPLAASVHAAFFEGTPVAGTEVALTGEDSTDATVRTSALGDATGQVTLGLSDPDAQWSVLEVQAHPTLPEEARDLRPTRRRGVPLHGHRRHRGDRHG